MCWKSAPFGKEGTESVSFTKLEAVGIQAWCWLASSSSVVSIVRFCGPLIQSLYSSKPHPFLNPSQILFSKAKNFSEGLGYSKEAIKVTGFQPSNTQCHVVWVGLVLLGYHRTASLMWSMWSMEKVGKAIRWREYRSKEELKAGCSRLSLVVVKRRGHISVLVTVDRLAGLSLWTSVTPLLLGNTANAANLGESSDSV